VQNSPFDIIQKKENKTGLPDNLKSGVENLSGHSMDDVKVHYNSSKPAQLQAHAYAQGTDIHVASGQEKHLPHEAWHVVQQKQGRVKPTMQMKGKVNVNDDKGLEREADVMGAKALEMKAIGGNDVLQKRALGNTVIQRLGEQEEKNDKDKYMPTWSAEADAFVWKQEDGKIYTKNEEGQVVTAKKEVKDETGKKTKVEVTESDLNFLEEKGGSKLKKEDIANNFIAEKSLAKIDEIVPSAINNLNPRGSLIRVIMQDSCYHSWEFMTHSLNKDGYGDSEKKGNRKTLLRKIWEYRQWHHDYILKKTQNQVGKDESGKDGLTEWKAAGSTTLTSDIDVNLKGSMTEKAVKVFNTLFKADGWKYEAGTVYDVNVYALDFMHSGYIFGSGEKTTDENGNVTTKDIHGNILKIKDKDNNTTTDNTTDGTKKTGKEGAKKGKAEGGFDNVFIEKEDAKQQEEWTFVKSRLYMTKTEWNDFAESIELDSKMKKKVEIKYDQYVTNMKAEMKGDVIEAEATIKGIQDLKKHAEAQVKSTGHIKDAEITDLMIGSSNKIYERKLVDIKGLRDELNSLTIAFDNGESNERQISKKLKNLREKLAEATLYSNEAYLTDGAVSHTVVDIQVGKDINLSNAEYKHALIENMADTLKEIGRHSGKNGDDLGEASFKSGKYIFRLADAGLKMDNQPKGDIGKMNKLKAVGKEISETIKGNSKLSKQQQHEASKKQISTLVNSVDELVALIKRLAGSYIKEN
jgi:hypothetical protein